MATAGPTITSATRHPSDPTILQVTYTVPVSGVTRVQLWEKGPTGAPVRIVDTTTLNGNISVHSRYAANVPVTLHMTLTHATEGASNAGSSVNVAAFKVATPTRVSATRASASTVCCRPRRLVAAWRSGTRPRPPRSSRAPPVTPPVAV